MSRKTKTPQDAQGAAIDPERIYVCAVSFAGDGLPNVVPEGTRLRGEHLAVQSFPGFWLPDGADDTELARARHRFDPSGIAEGRTDPPGSLSAGAPPPGSYSATRPTRSHMVDRV